MNYSELRGTDCFSTSQLPIYSPINRQTSKASCRLVSLRESNLVRGKAEGKIEIDLADLIPMAEVKSHFLQEAEVTGKETPEAKPRKVVTEVDMEIRITGREIQPNYTRGH